MNRQAGSAGQGGTGTETTVTQLWVPPGTRQAQVCGLPPGDVRLGDGRILRRSGRWGSEGYTYDTVDGLRVIASKDDTPHGRLLHVSMSYQHADPTWAEIRDVKAAFFGKKVDAMMLLPKAADYVNMHPHCMHLWECPTTWGIR